MRFTPLLVAATGMVIAACSSNGGMTGTPVPPVSTTSGNPLSTANSALAANSALGTEKTAPGLAQVHGNAGLNNVVVFTMNNESSRNTVVGYSARNGALRPMQPADTRGRGDPSVAGAVQGSLAFGDNGGLLFAVDPGSNEISSFRVGPTGLTFADKVSSNGTQPVSLAVRDNMLYVVNAGSSQITGFRIDENGKLSSIPGSTQPLSGKNVGPAEISFDSSGTLLMVTEKTTGKIDTYSVVNDVASGPTVHESSGTEPFGLAFLRAERLMVVADAFNGAPAAGAASSYLTTPNQLRLISSMVPDKNTAPCWIVVNPDSRVAYTSNTKSDTISAYGISAQGQLSLEKGNGISATTGKGPADLALTQDNKFLFVINLKGRTLGAYSVETDGKLDRLNDAPQLPNSALGLVALQFGS